MEGLFPAKQNDATEGVKSSGGLVKCYKPGVDSTSMSLYSHG